MMIAIPSGIQIFATLATLWTGRVWLTTPMLFVMGFVIIFVLGGITGRDGGLRALRLAGARYLFCGGPFPLCVDRGSGLPAVCRDLLLVPENDRAMLDERLGRWHFWLLFIGSTSPSLPCTYRFLGYAAPGVYLSFGHGLGLAQLDCDPGRSDRSLRHDLFVEFLDQPQNGRSAAGDNPWNAGTLEWATTSPPQPYNFATNSRYPLWEPAPLPEPYREDRVRVDEAGVQESLDNPDEPAYRADLADVLEDRFGLYERRRESVGTSTLDALPEQRIVLPGPTFIPFLAALAASFTFIGFMITPSWFPIGAAGVCGLCGLALAQPPAARYGVCETGRERGGAALQHGGNAVGNPPAFLVGVGGLVLIETVVFGALISSYFFLRSGRTGVAPGRH
jgi:cytochrome c oxidase subunit I+III